MAKFELLIAVVDEADLASGHNRKKEGDIVAVREAPFGWGNKEVDEYMIVVIESDKTEEELRTLFEEPLREGGYVLLDYTDLNIDPVQGKVDDIGLLKPEDLNDYVLRKADKVIMPRPKKTGKNRYRVRTGSIISLDLEKMRDKTKIYQPFKKKSQMLASPHIKPEEVDCVGVGVGEEEELVLSLETAKGIIQDNFNEEDIGGNL